MSKIFENVLKVYSKAVDNHHNPEFVGYGNPDSEILIIGQEATHKEGDADWKKFYTPNCEQWQKTLKEGYSAKMWDGIGEYKFPEYFNPRFPFRDQLYKIQKRDKDGKPLGDTSQGIGVSATWYWYQTIIDAVYPHQGQYIDFFDHCFITELSNLTRPHSSNASKKEREERDMSIGKRFDLMKQTSDFWSHFKIVIFACGHYADALINELSNFIISKKD